MGRKGASKRKPKKMKPVSAKGDSPVESLVKEKGAPVQNENMKNSGGVAKKKKKH
ncbi:hypothetical protein MASR2M66_25760 [Chloroflexota bacterium]